MIIQHEKPSLRLFFSVDLVGSTALKNRHDSFGSKPYWVTLIKGFYTDFQDDFRKSEPELELRIIPWKLLGDEILFFLEIVTQNDIKKSIKAFSNTLRNFKPKLEDLVVKTLQGSKHGYPKINIKGTAWLAGFPNINTSFSLPMSKELPEVIDFLGPSMDTGFRLTRHATPNRLVVSIELAHMLADTDSKTKLYFDGEHELKGVLSGVPYPVFWIHVEDNLSNSRMKLSGQKHRPPESVLKYVHEYVKRIGDDKLLCLPYLTGNDSYGKMPESHIQSLGQESPEDAVFTSKPRKNSKRKSKLPPELDAIEVIS